MMKWLMAVLCLSLTVGVCSLAEACTKFAGSFASAEGEIVRVAQLECQSITIASLENATAQPVVEEFPIDGQRHEIANMFWLTYWRGDVLVREPWSSQTGGMELGFRELWSLIGETLTDTKLDSTDGSEINHTVYHRTSSHSE